MSKSLSKSHAVNMSKAMNRPNPVNAPKPGGSRKTLYALAAGTAIVISIGIYFSSQQSARPPKLGLERQASAGQSVAAAQRTAVPPAAAHPSGALDSAEPFFDFGKISMAAGKVSRAYWIKNTSAAPLTITKIYTSCMCTDATLLTQSGRKKGPFGMPGHAPIPDIEERLGPGQVAQVEVVFDPAAHGPAGIGKIDRIVTVQNNAGRPLELRFNAMVTP